MKHPYAEILHAIADGVPVQFRSDGSAWVDFKLELHAPPTAKTWFEWQIKPQPKTGTFWVNVLERGVSAVTWDSRQSADNNIPHGLTRIACVEVHWTEGEGL